MNDKPITSGNGEGFETTCRQLLKVFDDSYFVPGTFGEPVVALYVVATCNPPRSE
jgi:hypothetical protein